MPRELRVFFHFRSPYSRVGLHRLAAGDSAESLIPTKLHILTHAAGETEPINPMRTKPRMSYVMQDVPRVTLRAGLPIQAPTLDVDWTPAYRAFYAARDEGKALGFAAALSDLRWGTGADISDPAVIDQACAAVGLPAGIVVDDWKDRLKADAAQVDADGAFGVPFAVIDRGTGRAEPFFGQDRFEMMLDILREEG